MEGDQPAKTDDPGASGGVEPSSDNRDERHRPKEDAPTRRLDERPGGDD